MIASPTAQASPNRAPLSCPQPHPPGYGVCEEHSGWE